MTVRELVKELQNLPKEYLDEKVKVYNDTLDEYYKIVEVDWGVDYGDDEVEMSKNHYVILPVNLLSY